MTSGFRTLLSASCVAFLAATGLPLASGSTSRAGAPRGVYQTLRSGMTLYRISRIYGVPVGVLMKANGIVDATSIPAGSRIFVPGASVSRQGTVRPGAPKPAAPFAWPLRGAITSPFGARGDRSRHTGIDIDGEEGDPIAAAADGRVARVENDPKYGRLVVLEHRGGYETWYAHASEILVEEGEEVSRGRTIALVGHSGDARGTHLHFEVRLKDEPLNPLAFLDAGRSAPPRATPSSPPDRRSSPRRRLPPTSPSPPRIGS